MEFCNLASRSCLPTSEDTLLLFVSYLAQQGLSHTSIKVYLSAVRLLHISAGLHDQFTQQTTPRLELVLKGIQKESAPKRSRLPITLDIMEKIKEALLLHPKQPDNIMMWAACCTAFFGFLRCSEFTVPAEDSFDPEAHLSLADVAVDDKMSPTVVQVTIKQSKTDPFRQGAHLYLGTTDTVICPVKAMLAYLAVRDPAPGPLFKLTYKKCLTRQAFSTLLSRTLTTAGVSNKGFTTHSFRIGAATSAKEAGISDVHIKMLGRWKSEAYQLYVRTPRERLAKLSKQLASGGGSKE